MPIPTVNCMICQQGVTKRSTLSLSSLGLGDGRACRTHPEVEQALAAKVEMAKRTAAMKLATAELRILSGVAAVRVMHSFFGWPASLILDRLHQSRQFTDREVEQVIERVKKEGLEMGEDEKRLVTIAAADLMAQRIAQKHGLEE